MKPDLQKWSLVVVGSWNTRILSPDWLAKNVFHVQNIQVLFPVLGDAPPVYRAEDIQITVADNRIVVAPMRCDNELLQRIEDAAWYLLDTLPYTPVTAFGQNFHYEVESSAPGLEQILRFSDIPATTGRINETALKRAISMPDCVLNLTITQSESMSIDLNYHYAVDDAKDASTRIEGSFLENRKHGIDLLRELYGLTVQQEVHET